MRAQDSAVGVALIDYYVAQRAQEAGPPLMARQEGEVQEVGVGEHDVGVSARPIALGQGGVAIAGADAHGADRPGRDAVGALDGLDLGHESFQGGRLVGGEGLGGGEVQRGRAAAVFRDVGSQGAGSPSDVGSSAGTPGTAGARFAVPGAAPGAALSGRPGSRIGPLGGEYVGDGRQPGRQRLARARTGGQDGVATGVDGVGGPGLVHPRRLHPEVLVGGYEQRIRPGGPLAVAGGVRGSALEVDEPAVARTDALQELGEVASGPVCHEASVPQGCDTNPPASLLPNSAMASSVCFCRSRRQTMFP